MIGARRMRGGMVALAMLLAAAAGPAPDPAASEPPAATEEIPPDDTMPAPPEAAPTAPALGTLTAAPEHVALLVEGDGETRIIDCAGRDVLIHGDGGTYRLTRGCHAISVQGRGHRIDAELQPGARIAIGGPDVTLRYVLIRPGAPALVSVTATNSHAIAVDRLDGTR
jgi:hypothetical protein